MLTFVTGSNGATKQLAELQQVGEVPRQRRHPHLAVGRRILPLDVVESSLQQRASNPNHLHEAVRDVPHREIRGALVGMPPRLERLEGVGSDELRPGVRGRKAQEDISRVARPGTGRRRTRRTSTRRSAAPMRSSQTSRGRPRRSCSSATGRARACRIAHRAGLARQRTDPEGKGGRASRVRVPAPPRLPPVLTRTPRRRRSGTDGAATAASGRCSAAAAAAPAPAPALSPSPSPVCLLSPRERICDPVCVCDCECSLEIRVIP